MKILTGTAGERLPIDVFRDWDKKNHVFIVAVFRRSIFLADRLDFVVWIASDAE